MRFSVFLLMRLLGLFLRCGRDADEPLARALGVDRAGADRAVKRAAEAALVAAQARTDERELVVAHLADVVRLGQERTRQTDHVAAAVSQRLRASARPELTALPERLDDYEEIYLGYPNYCGTMPMAVYTFLEHYDWQGKTIHPFCTNEGSGLSNTEQDIRRAAKGARVAPGLSLRGSAVDSAKPKLEQWVRG